VGYESGGDQSFCFFYLSDLFLSSTHLPQYLVAAFVKRFARLALSAQPNTTLVIIGFIRNLIIRHPNLSLLCHNPSGPTDLEGDPYDAEEPDMSKCRALESSLWELKTLQSHFVPEVASSAKMVEKILPTVEKDIGERYEISMHDMIEKELSRNWKEVPLTYEKPKGLSLTESDTGMSQFWRI